MAREELVRLAVLTDLHLAAPGTSDARWIGSLPLGRSGELLSHAADRVRAEAPDAVLLLGDLTQDGTDAQFDQLAGGVSKLPRPVWAVPGNHDLGGGADPRARLGDLVGRAGPSGTDAYGLHLAAGQLGQVGGGYRETALPQPGTWPVDRPAVWLSHFPVLDLRPAVAAAGLPYAGNLDNRADVQAALRDHDGPVLVLAGHLHLAAAVADGPVLQLSFPALIEPPHQLSVVEVQGRDGRVRVERRLHALVGDAPGPTVNRFRTSGPIRTVSGARMNRV